MSKLDLRKESEKRLKNKVARKYKRNTKLQELERQLEFAESRCGTLKQQLDYIKQLYGCGRSKVVEKQSPKEEGHGDGSTVNYYYSYGDVLRWNREDGDGPDFIKSSTAIIQLNSRANSSEKTITQEKEEAKGKTVVKSKALKLKMKNKTSRKIKRKRIRVERQMSSKESNASNQTQTQTCQDAVVELYKNMTLNVESESGLEIFTKNVPNKRSGVFPDALKLKLKKIGSHGQDEAKGDLKTKSCGSLIAKKEGTFTKEEGIQTDLPIDGNPLGIQNKRSDASDYYKDPSIRAESLYMEPLKSYCMPTISSKRKQVDRDIYSSVANINVRNIPFIAAKSTAPSHNIGVNIQQVLSIIKKRHPVNENLINQTESGNHENPILSALINAKKLGNKAMEQEPVSEPCTGVSGRSKRRIEAPKSNLSHWRSTLEEDKEMSPQSSEKMAEESDWSLKVEKLKKVLVCLHEDFTSLSQKYKRLQKKLTKRNITRTDAKDELADIERELEKKEEEITIVIALYKEVFITSTDEIYDEVLQQNIWVLNLKEDFKKLQEKYDLVTCGRNLMIGLKQSNSTHTQMTSLLRKIQKFQDKLKG